MLINTGQEEWLAESHALAGRQIWGLQPKQILARAHGGTDAKIRSWAAGNRPRYSCIWEGDFSGTSSTPGLEPLCVAKASSASQLSGRAWAQWIHTTVLLASVMQLASLNQKIEKWIVFTGYCRKAPLWWEEQEEDMRSECKPAQCTALLPALRCRSAGQAPAAWEPHVEAPRAACTGGARMQTQ